MNRRNFLSSFAAIAATAVVDPEKLLWVPGAKKIFIPPPRRVFVPVRFIRGYDIRTNTMYSRMDALSIMKNSYGFSLTSVAEEYPGNPREMEIAIRRLLIERRVDPASIHQLSRPGGLELAEIRMIEL